MASKKETRIPSLNNLESVKEALDVRLGRRGDPLDRAITVRDLTESGLPVKAVRRSSLTDFTVEYDEQPEKWVPDAPFDFVAYPAFGGINLVWGLPREDYMISHTQVHRSQSSDPLTRVFLTSAGGMMHFDVLDNQDQTTYYYWIRHVSVSGHIGPFAGPVEAASLPLVTDIIERITGEIDAGVLAQSLKKEIDLISGPETLIGSINFHVKNIELQMKAEEDARIAAIQAESAARIEALKQEVTAREQAVQAEAEARANALRAESNARQAAISQEHTQWVSATEALASRADALLATTDGLGAKLTNEEKVRSDQYSALAEQQQILTAASEKAFADIGIERQARIDDVSSLTSTIQSQVSQLEQDYLAAILDERATRTTITDSLAQQINSVRAATDTNEASIQRVDQTLTSNVSALSSAIESLTARLDATPVWVSSFETGSDFDQWSTAGGSTIAAYTADDFGGTQSAAIGYSGSNPTSGGATGGVHARITDSIAQNFSEKRVRISGYAKKYPVAAEAATEFAVAYSTAEVGNSGWQHFTVEDDWTLFEFLWDVPGANNGGADYIGIWGDTSNGGKKVLIDQLNIQQATSEEDLPAITAAINEEAAARVEGDAANATKLTAAEARLDGAIGGVQSLLNTEIQRVDGRITVASQKADSTEARIDQAIADTNSRMTSEVSELEDGIAAVSRKVDNTKAALDGSIAETQSYAESQVSRLDGRINAASKKVDTVSASLEDDYSKRIADAQSALMTEIDKVGDSVTVASRKVDTVKSELKSDLGKLDSDLQGQINADKQALTDGLAAAQSNLNSAVNRLDGEINAQSRKTDTVRSQLTESIAAGDSALDTKLGTLRKDLTSGLAAAETDLNSEVKKLDDKIVAQSSKTDSVKAQLTSQLNKSESDLQKRLDGLDDELSDGLAEAQSKLDSNVEQLEKSIAANSSKTDTVRSQLNNAINSAKNSLQNSINATNDAITKGLAAAQSSLTSAVKSLEGKITAQSQKTDRVESSLEGKINGVSGDLNRGLATAQSNLDSQVSSLNSKITAQSRKTDTVKAGLQDDISDTEKKFTGQLAAAKSDLSADINSLDGKITAQANKTDLVQTVLGNQIAAVEVSSSVRLSGMLLTTNGSFATGTFAGWSANSGITVVQRDADRGAFSATRNAPAGHMAQFSPDSRSRYVYGDYAPVNAGDTYAVRFDYAGGGYDSIGARLYLQYRDENQSFVANQTVDVTVNSTAWKRSETKQFTVPDRAVECRVIMRRSPGNNRRTVFVTNIVAQRMDASSETLWTARVQSGGLIGGFGLGNDGETVEAGFDVDRFWVGRTNSDKRKPFIIEDGFVYMNKVMIADGSIQEGQLGPITIGKLTKADGTPVTTVGGLIRADAIDVNNLSVREATRFTGDVFSSNYQPGKRGWAMLQSGYVEFNEAMIRGNLEVQSITVNGSSPFGAIRLGTSDRSQSDSEGNSRYNVGFNDKYNRDYDNTKSSSQVATQTLSKMPKGSRISIIAYPRVYGSADGKVGNYRPGDAGDNIRPSSSRGGMIWDMKVRTRVWVDGKEILDKTHTQSKRSERLGPLGFSHEYEHPNARGGYNTEFTYPAYKSTSTIKAQIDVTMRVRLYGGNVGASYKSTGANMATGDVFRLG